MTAPNHVAVVPNGNRRKSRMLGLPLEMSYVKGAQRALDVARWAKKAGVGHVTFYGLSCENLKNRSDFEIDALMKGAIQFLDLVAEIGRVHAFGNIDEFQGVEKYEPLYKRLKALNGSFEDSGMFTIHVAANYSGLPQHELRPLLQALRSRGFADVEPELTRYLLSGGVPPVDLFIRTGGEHRTSGLLPFQSVYAELYFTDVLWADFSEEQFQAALDWFAKQQRNFGK